MTSGSRPKRAISTFQPRRPGPADDLEAGEPAGEVEDLARVAADHLELAAADREPGRGRADADAVDREREHDQRARDADGQRARLVVGQVGRGHGERQQQEEQAPVTRRASTRGANSTSVVRPVGAGAASRRRGGVDATEGWTGREPGAAGRAAAGESRRAPRPPRGRPRSGRRRTSTGRGGARAARGQRAAGQQERRRERRRRRERLRRAPRSSRRPPRVPVCRRGGTANDPGAPRPGPARRTGAKALLEISPAEASPSLP